MVDFAHGLIDTVQVTSFFVAHVVEPELRMVLLGFFTKQTLASFFLLSLRRRDYSRQHSGRDPPCLSSRVVLGDRSTCLVD